MIISKREHERIVHNLKNEIAMVRSDLRLSESLRSEKEEENRYLREKTNQLIGCISNRDVVNNLLTQQGSKLVP